MLFLMDVPPMLPKPQGKPAAMEEMAAACRRVSNGLAEGAQSAASSVESMLFTAPVVSRIRGSVRGNTNAMASIASDLDAFATELETGAEKLQDRIDKYEKRLKQIDAAEKNNRAYEAAKKLGAERAAAAAAAGPMGQTGPLFR
jgi:prefoldin subunit 5